MAAKKWHFEFYETECAGWFLRIDSMEDIILYMSGCDLLDKDKNHYKYLESYPQSNHKDNIVAHTNYGFFASRIKDDTGLGTDDAYDVIKCLQASSMMRVMESSGRTLLVNRQGGFMIMREDMKPKASVWRKELKFPRYLSSDIRIKRFDDGSHYYAYIGDMQVKDGDRLKWNTYEEAYQQAVKYAADKIRQRKQEELS